MEEVRGVQDIPLTREEKMELLSHWNAIQLVEARANQQKARHGAAIDALWAKIGERIELPLLGEADFANVDPVSFNGPVLHRVDAKAGKE